MHEARIFKTMRFVPHRILQVTLDSAQGVRRSLSGVEAQMTRDSFSLLDKTPAAHQECI